MFILNCFITRWSVESVRENEAKRFCFELALWRMWYKMAEVNDVYNHGKYEQIWLNNLRVSSNITVFLRQPAGQTQLINLNTSILIMSSHMDQQREREKGGGGGWGDRQTQTVLFVCVHITKEGMRLGDVIILFLQSVSHWALRNIWVPPSPHWKLASYPHYTKRTKHTNSYHRAHILIY